MQWRVWRQRKVVVAVVALAAMEAVAVFVGSGGRGDTAAAGGAVWKATD